ncbi:MAG TPA: response regulator [Pirellulales bacterium]|nr:response regulator [Pirellulales bacterium]
MKRILFVDDDSGVLDGLRRMLRGMRHEWETVFTGSGAEALRLLEQIPFDVVVTDMRMPGMDGAQLLEEVMRRHAETIRIVLSGQADGESVLRSIGSAHQYLSKPCDESTVKATIARALLLRQWISEPTIKQLVARVTSLPSLPSLYAELVAELRSAESSIQRIAAIISRDVGMTAKILQLVNSSYFGLRQRVATPSQAVAHLGIDVLRALVLSVHTFAEYEGLTLAGFSIDALFDHSLAVGALAKQVVQKAGGTAEQANDALVAGMLHDVGKLVLASNLQDRYAAALTLARREPMPLVAAENEVFGCSHAEVGAYLLALWGLSDAVVEAVAFHHQPARSAVQSFSALTAVHVANALARECELSPREPSPIDDDYLAGLGLFDRLPGWRELADGILCEGVMQ